MSSRVLTRWVFAGLAASAVVFLGACGGGGAQGTATMVPPQPTATASQTITLTMLDNSFEPNAVTVRGGTTVKFTLPNAGRALHNMHIATADGRYRQSPWVSTPEPIAGGQTGELTWAVPPGPGSFKFRCDYHEVAMIGVITVE